MAGKGLLRTPHVVLRAPFENENSHAVFSQENAHTHDFAFHFRRLTEPTKLITGFLWRQGSHLSDAFDPMVMGMGLPD